MSGSHFIVQTSNFLLIQATVVTLGQGQGKVAQYIFPDLCFLCPKYIRFRSNGFAMRSRSPCGAGGGRGRGRGENELKIQSNLRPGWLNYCVIIITLQIASFKTPACNFSLCRLVCFVLLTLNPTFLNPPIKCSLSGIIFALNIVSVKMFWSESTKFPNIYAIDNMNCSRIKCHEPFSLLAIMTRAPWPYRLYHNGLVDYIIVIHESIVSRISNPQFLASIIVLHSSILLCNFLHFPK